MRLPFLFQSTRPRGARPASAYSAAIDSGFNPRAREGRDNAVRYNVTIITVSIHAPARGATVSPVISPVKSSRFNPRAREGRDSSYSDASKIKARDHQFREPPLTDPKIDSFSTVNPLSGRINADLRTSREINEHMRFALHQQHPFRIIAGASTDMFHSCFPIAAEKIIT